MHCKPERDDGGNESTIDGGDEVNYDCHWSSEHEENNEIDQNSQHQRSCSPDKMGGRQGDDDKTSFQVISLFIHFSMILLPTWQQQFQPYQD